MATKNIENIRLKLVLDGGMVDGKMKKVNRTYSGIKKDVSVDSLYSVSKEITDLQNKPVINVLRLEEAIITE